MVGVTFNRMESYHPLHRLVYYKFLKEILAHAVNSNSGISLLQDPRFIANEFCR